MKVLVENRQYSLRHQAQQYLFGTVSSGKGNESKNKQKRLGQAKMLFQRLLWQHVYNIGVIQRRLAWPSGKMT